MSKSAPRSHLMVSNREVLVNQDLLIKTLKGGQDNLERELTRTRSALQTEKNLNKQLKRACEIKIKEEVEKECAKWTVTLTEQKRRSDCEKNEALQRQKFRLLRSFRAQLSRAIHEKEGETRRYQIEAKNEQNIQKSEHVRAVTLSVGSLETVGFLRENEMLLEQIAILEREKKFLEDLVEKQCRAPEVEIVRELEHALQAEKSISDHYKAMLHSLLEGPHDRGKKDDIESVCRRNKILQIENLELKAAMAKATEVHEREKTTIMIRLNDAEAKLAPLKYQHQKTLARNIKLAQTNKEWQEKALSAKKENAARPARKSGIPVRRTKSAPTEASSIPNCLPEKSKEVMEKENNTTIVSLIPSISMVAQQKPKHFRFERKQLQRLKCGLPTLMECEGETKLDGSKSPDSETSEDSGFCGELGRKDLEMMYTHLFREHQELQRAHAATRIMIGNTGRRSEARKGSESPKWDYSDIQMQSGPSLEAPQETVDSRTALYEKKLERLRLRNMALESELQDMHDQNELLEFRLLELEECQGNKRRDMFTEMEGFEYTSDSGNGSLSWNGDSSVCIRIACKEDPGQPTLIHSKIEEHKNHLRSLAPRLTYHEDKAIVFKTIAILEACQVLVDKLEKQSRNVTRIHLQEMKFERLQESGIFDDSGFEDGHRCDFSGQTDFEEFDVVLNEIESLRKFKRSVEHLRLAPVLPILSDREEKATQAEHESHKVKELSEKFKKMSEEKQMLSSQLDGAKIEVNNLLEKLGAAEVALVNTVNQLETEASKRKAFIDYLEEVKQEVLGAFFDIGIEKSDESDIWCIKTNLEALRECLRLYSGGKATDSVSIYIKDTLESDLSNNNIEEPLNKELEKFYLDQIENLQKEKIGLRRVCDEEKQKLRDRTEELEEMLQNAERQIEENLEKLHTASELLRKYESEKDKSLNENDGRVKFLESELRQLDDYYSREMTSQKQAFLKDYDELCAKQNECQLKVNKLRDVLNEICQELEFDMIKNPDTANPFSSISEILFDDECGEMLVERVRNLLHEESAMRQKCIDLERKERAYRETLQEADAIMARVEEQHRTDIRALEENERQLQEKVSTLQASEKRLCSLLQEKEGVNTEELMTQLNNSFQLITSLREQLAELEHVNADLNFKLIEEQEQHQATRALDLENAQRLRESLGEYELHNGELKRQIKALADSKSNETEVEKLVAQVGNLEEQIRSAKRSLALVEKALREEHSKYEELATSKRDLELQNGLLAQEIQSLRESQNDKMKERDAGLESEEASLRAEISKMRNQLSVAQSQMQELESINCTLRESVKRTEGELKKAMEEVKILSQRKSSSNVETQTSALEIRIEPYVPTSESYACPKCSIQVPNSPHGPLSSEEILEDITLTEKFIDDIFDEIDSSKVVPAEIDVLKAELEEKQTVLEVLDSEARQLTMKLSEKDEVIRDLESNLLSTSKENDRLKEELETVRATLGKSLQEATFAKQNLERKRAVGRSSSFSGVRTPRERPRSVRFEPKTIEERVNEKRCTVDQVEVPPPAEFKVTRRVGDDGLVVAWVPPDCENVCGYLICANEQEVQRVRSADRTKAVLYNLPPCSNLSLTIQSVTKDGSISKPASTYFNPEAFNEIDTSKRA